MSTSPRLELFGTRVRLVVGQPLSEGLPSPEAVALDIEGFLRVLHRRLTRFERNSELAALNDFDGEAFEASSILFAAVDAALWWPSPVGLPRRSDAHRRD